ncbi:hypothetical protein [Micromonospora nigra]|uniref:hypothetical protein n=1 Tax=Micromonospora nigra TaxID=145857 RepID=UPI001112DB23|nr:hypothetical protein [Micromonospora nigra]
MAFTFLGGLALLTTARRRQLDRVTVVPAAVWAFVYLGLGHRLGDWSVVPAWLWPVGVAVSAVGVALAANRWRDLPTIDAKARWRRMLSVAGSLAVAAVAVAFVAT